MKKLMMGFLALVMLPLAALANQFEEGKHYEVIKMAAPSAQPMVTEYFSFLCPHCYRFEPFIKELKGQLPEGVKLQKNHVDFMGREMGVELSRAWAVMELLGVEEQVASKLFASIHVQRQIPKSRDDIRNIFVAAGVKGEDFDAAVNSFSINGRLSQMQRNTLNNEVHGVPTLIINGKYKVNTGSVSSKEELFELVNWLAKKDA
ncbi:thiol:disulfide interchange protein DsbA/DsbL [Gallaecimonas sp. GXIMD4217]|uniref:thiol:disulfide interchange protein DsbA/DsbL n=1 Tax=Gallaecimonas sp. GXIMD4217 TaxID=3131927 RepID=UPI00311B2A8C